MVTIVVEQLRYLLYVHSVIKGRSVTNFSLICWHLPIISPLITKVSKGDFSKCHIYFQTIKPTLSERIIFKGNTNNQGNKGESLSKTRVRLTPSESPLNCLIVFWPHTTRDVPGCPILGVSINSTDGRVRLAYEWVTTFNAYWLTTVTLFRKQQPLQA